jgi:hypothetical protein
MKNYALAPHTFAFFFFSCNNTKAADEKRSRKIAVAVDTVKKKAINIIDTIDYNKRMQVSNNDTTEGR